MPKISLGKVSDLSGHKRGRCQRVRHLLDTTVCFNFMNNSSAMIHKVLQTLILLFFFFSPCIGKRVVGINKGRR